MTGLDDWLVSTVRYFGACPICGRRERGGEITYATPAEVATAEQTHGCCSTELLPPVLLVVAVYEIAPTAATTQPAWWLKNADGTRRCDPGERRAVDTRHVRRVQRVLPRARTAGVCGLVSAVLAWPAASADDPTVTSTRPSCERCGRRIADGKRPGTRFCGKACRARD